VDRISGDRLVVGLRSNTLVCRRHRTGSTSL
jgi:hypothetical protein